MFIYYFFNFIYFYLLFNLQNLSFSFELDGNYIEHKNSFRNQLLFFIMIILNFFLLSQNFQINYFNTIFLIFLIYFLFNLKGQRLGFFSHYYLPFFLILFQIMKY